MWIFVIPFLRHVTNCVSYILKNKKSPEEVKKQEEDSITLMELPYHSVFRCQLYCNEASATYFYYVINIYNVKQNPNLAR